MIKAGLAAVMLVMGSAANATLYSATFSGAAERPTPVVSEGKGFGTLRVLGDSIRVEVTFSDLGSGLRDGHIHAVAGPEASAPVAIGFPDLTPLLGSTSGVYSALIDLTLASTYRPAFITANGGTVEGAQARLLAALDSGEAYFNLHTVNFPGGEIRGNLTAVPEPASWAMMVMGFGLAGAVMRRRVAPSAA